VGGVPVLLIKRVIADLQENLSRPVYLPKTATEQLKELFEKQQQNLVSSLDEKQGE
jgi:methyltransferase-like protein